MIIQNLFFFFEERGSFFPYFGSTCSLNNVCAWNILLDTEHCVFFLELSISNINYRVLLGFFFNFRPMLHERRLTFSTAVSCIELVSSYPHVEQWMDDYDSHNFTFIAFLEPRQPKFSDDKTLWEYNFNIYLKLPISWITKKKKLNIYILYGQGTALNNQNPGYNWLAALTAIWKLSVYLYIFNEKETF